MILLHHLAFIVGNDLVNGSTTRNSQETKDGNLLNELVEIEDFGFFTMPMDGTSELDEDFLRPNDYSAFIRKNPSTHSSSSWMSKKRKACMAASLDVICESIQDICMNMRKAHLFEI